MADAAVVDADGRVAQIGLIERTTEIATPRSHVLHGRRDRRAERVQQRLVLLGSTAASGPRARQQGVVAWLGTGPESVLSGAIPSLGSLRFVGIRPSVG